MRKRQIYLVLTAVIALLALAAPAHAGSSATARERALLSAMNEARGQHGLASLRLDTKLRKAARTHSTDMIRRSYFSHGPMGRRLQSFGARGPFVGENLAWAVGDRASARSIVRMWLGSPSHRANLLRPGFRRVGIGSVTGSFMGHAGASVVTADFAGR